MEIPIDMVLLSLSKSQTFALFGGVCFLAARIIAPPSAEYNRNCLKFNVNFLACCCVFEKDTKNEGFYVDGVRGAAENCHPAYPFKM
jgi:hypothetical protein